MTVSKNILGLSLFSIGLRGSNRGASYTLKGSLLHADCNRRDTSWPIIAPPKWKAFAPPLTPWAFHSPGSQRE